MKVSLYCDIRRTKNDGTCPVKVQVSHKGKNVYISTPISVDPKRWDKAKQVIKSGSDALWKNEQLHSMKAKTEMIVQKSLSRDGELSAQELKKIVDANIGKMLSDDETNNDKSFVDYYTAFANEHHGRTKEMYFETLDLIRKYDSSVDILSLDDIDVQWLAGFNSYMMPTCPSENTRSMKLRNLKAVMKRAEDEDVIRKSPFRIFKIPKAQPRHIDMQTDDFIKLIKWPCELSQEPYRDFFLLSFMMRGINNSDLLLARWSDVNGEYLEYDRQKTGKEYKIKLEPEMMTIINKYRGKKNLLKFLDGVSLNGDEEHDHEVHEQIHKYTQAVNKHLKRIGEWKNKRTRRVFVKGLFPHVKMYSARHTWATIAYEICDDYKAVEDGLGHSKNVTDRYVRRTQKKVDEVTRQMIDYINNYENSNNNTPGTTDGVMQPS